MILNFKSGQLVLETLVAIAVTSLVLVGLLAVISRGIKNTDIASQLSLASSYTEEGLEMARRERDGADTWNEFKTDFDGDKCLDSKLRWDDCDCSVTSSPNIGTTFFRCLNFKADGDDKRKVTATVFWEEGGRSHQVQAITFLTKWSK